MDGSRRDVLALVLGLAFIGLGIPLRIALQVLRHGDHGVRLSRRRTTPMLVAVACFVLAVLLFAAAPVAGLLGLARVPGLDHAAAGWAGAVLTLVGAVTTFAVQVAMGRHWRIGQDADEQTELVTGGAFAVVRHPIYLALTVGCVGLTLLAGNAIALAGLASIVTAVLVQTRAVEEPHLRRVHGRAYAEYESRVGRLLPGVGRTQHPAA